MGEVLPFMARSLPVPGPAERRQAIESALERTMDATDCLLALLDSLDGDPDAEPNGDDEPSLGAPVGGDSQVSWSAGGSADLEQALTRLGRACRALPPSETNP